MSIVIIGAGAAGLMAAYELSKHKIHVTVLEAKNRLGGRIHTTNNASFSKPVEEGAEFIHGDLPLTLSLLNKSGISYHAINDKMYRLEKGKLKKENNFTEHWNTLMHQMALLKQDMPLAVFLNTYFNDEKYAELKTSVKNFAGGFDLADISTASTKALYGEWSEEMGTQYRVDNGYKKLVDYLETKCRSNGCIFSLSCCAKKINWQKDEVNVLTMCSRMYKANKIIVAVPVSVLQANLDSEDYLEFNPAIPQHTQAAKKIGFGAVIKIILEFSENFWDEKKKGAGFIFTNGEVSTWWTQSPEQNNILTGWLGSEKALAAQNYPDEIILNKSIKSLSEAFDISAAKLRGQLKAFKIANWCKEPDINGGYSFKTTESAGAKQILRQPVDNTIFFAGEALFEGVPGGTVEAALQSGKETAHAILKSLSITA